jgi:hypothetical protein
MNKFDMAELNELVQAGVGAILIVCLTIGLLFFGYAMGY